MLPVSVGSDIRVCGTGQPGRTPSARPVAVPREAQRPGDPLGSVSLVNLNLFNDVPDGLTRRARSFVQANGVKVDIRPVAEHGQWCRERDIPATVIDRMVAYEERWGGLVLPPASQYDGGPRYLEADSPAGSASEGWWFKAGMQRTAVPYSFMIGPSGEFGIHADKWVPLHATVEGWVESLALTHHASTCAKQIVKAPVTMSTASCRTGTSRCAG